MRTAAQSSENRKRVWRMAVWWAVLVALSLTIHSICWGSWAPAALTEALKPAANILQMVTLPGWLVMRVAAKVIPMPFGVHVVVAYAMAAAAWIAGAHLAMAVRRRGMRPRTPEPAAPSVVTRRRFLTDGAFALTGLAGSTALAESVLLEPFNVCVREYNAPIAGLPRGLDGLRITYLSDTHLGPRIPEKYLKGVVAQALSVRPGLIALGGDYVHMGVEHIEPAAALFRPLVESGVPVVGVLGNHDWYADGPRMSRALAAIGVRMIDNTRIFLDEHRRLLEDPHDNTLCIAGVGDLEMDRIDADAAIGGAPGLPAVVLAHEPDTAELPAWSQARRAASVELMLCGHTHGGQVRIPGLGTPIVPSAYGQKYAGGMVRGPHFPVIVSRGIGMSLLPVRFLVPPEIVVVTLARA